MFMEDNMNNDHTNNTRDLDEYSEDALSFCDLLMDKDGETELYYACPENPNTQEQDLFEFFVNPNQSETFPLNSETVEFCGKTMSPILKTAQEFQRHPNNGLYIQRESFKRCHSFLPESCSVNKPPLMASTTDRHNTFRVGGSVPSPATGNCQYKNSGSRKHKVLIGLVQVQSKMEMSEIMKRQSRRAPAPIFSVANGGELVIVGDDKMIRGRSHWGFLRPLHNRSHLK